MIERFCYFTLKIRYSLGGSKRDMNEYGSVAEFLLRIISN